MFHAHPVVKKLNAGGNVSKQLRQYENGYGKTLNATFYLIYENSYWYKNQD